MVGASGLAQTGSAGVAPSGTEGDPVLINGHPAHPTRILARLKPGQNVKAHASALSAEGLTAIRSSALVPGLVVLDEDTSRVSALSMSGASATPAVAPDAEARAVRLQARISSLLGSGLFEYVEPDCLVRADATPSDSAFSDGTLWGLRNTAVSNGADINAVRAWDVTTGSSEVIVAVIDSGIRYTHQDLAANMWSNPGEVPGNGRDDDGNGYIDDVHGIDTITGSGNPNDNDGHGTHVAGIIGAVANNGHPMVGVAWNVRLMAVKFLGASGTGYVSDAIEGIGYAIGKGAKILNCSWGDYEYQQSLYDSIAVARDRGVLVVASAGNDALNVGINPHYPSSLALDNVIAVAAMHSVGGLANFSNFGLTSVDLAAPGVALYSTTNSSDSAYTSLDGTSGAAAFVSGTAALVQARFPTITMEELRYRILYSRTHTWLLAGITERSGYVNAGAAVADSGDGELELVLEPARNSTLHVGKSEVLTVRVRDLVNITNATVTGTLSSGVSLQFRDDGVAPDAIQGDAVYSASFAVPLVESLGVEIAVSAPGKTAATLNWTYQVDPTPLNDMFADRFAMTISTGTWGGLSGGGSAEPGEPSHAGQPANSSVWWTWTAPRSGPVTLEVNGMDFDPRVAVYRGTTLNSLVAVASNDDREAGVADSRVQFTATSGVAYQFAIDGRGTTARTYYMILTTPFPPANDDFANAIVLDGADASALGTTANATLEPGENLPSPYGQTLGSSWWQWTAPFAGTANFSAVHSGNLSGQFVAYVGDSIATLQPVPTSYSGWGGEEFYTPAGVTYRIMVPRRSSDPPYAMTVSVSLRPGPANDRFVDRIQLVGDDVVFTGSNAYATREPGEPSIASRAAGMTIWWTWTAPRTGAYRFHTTGKECLAAIGLFTGDSFGTLSLVGSAQTRSFPGRPDIVFSATQGTTYQLALDATNGMLTSESGLHLGAIPVNDSFSNRTALGEAPASAVIPARAASRESSEPNHAGLPPRASVWWTWTAREAGVVLFSTNGSDFDTRLSVYTGESIGALTEAGTNLDASPTDTASAVALNVTVGTTYSVVVDAEGDGLGTAALNVDYALRRAGGVTVVGAAANLGGSITLSGAGSGMEPLEYQWLLDGREVPRATAPTLEIPFAQRFHAGAYALRISNGYGSVVSEPMTVTVEAPTTSPDTRLMNISTRAPCGSGDAVLITGFVVKGSGAKRVLIRMVGPELAPLGVASPMPDPHMVLKQLVGDSYQDIGSNDNWGASADAAGIASTGRAVGAFSLAVGSASAALLVDLPAGQYTVIGSDATGANGVGIIEVYDADASAPSARLSNISTRGFVGSGDSIMIPGFIVSEEGPRTVLLRAVGPRLAAAPFSIPGTLADPRLSVYRRAFGSSTDTLILTNDNWGENGDAAQVAQVAADVGAFGLATASADSAFVVTLPPGLYTVQASGADGATGVALVEVYVVE